MLCKALFLATLVAVVHGQTGDDVKALLKKLFVTNEYNKSVRPKEDQTKTLILELEFVLNSIISFDAQEESLTTAGYLGLSWIDEYLTWDKASHNDIEVLFIPQDDIWKPDVSLRNSYKSFSEMGSSYLNLKLYHDGRVEWLPFQVLKSTCAVDITYFPFDTQTCEMKFITWSYNRDQVDLSVGPGLIQLEEYSPNSAWDLVNTGHRIVSVEEASVIFTLTLKRKPMFYIMNMAIPVLMLTMLNVFTFALPAASGERNGFAITVFLALAVFLTIVASEMPQNSDTVSIFGVYLTAMTLLSTFVVITCLLLSRIASRDVSNHPVGKVFRVLHSLSLTLQCRRSCRRKNNVGCDAQLEKTHKMDVIDSDLRRIEVDGDNTPEKDAPTWEAVVNSLDYLCFWFAILFTIVCTTTIAVMAVHNS